MILAAILISVLMFGLVGGVAFYFIRKTSPDTTVGSGPSANSAQGFLPLADIRDGYMVLKDGSLRRAIECSSINFDLKTEEEQASIEMIFQRFLNSLTFPVSFFLQTRIIDNSKRLRILEEEISSVKRDFPKLEDYADQYLRAMGNINEELQSFTQKKKFIIVPFDDRLEVDSLSSEEKEEYIRKQLDNRCSIVLNGLANLGIRASILSTEDLVDLMYSTTHRDDYSFAENLTENEALSLFVEGSSNVSTKKDSRREALAAVEAALNQLSIHHESLEDKGEMLEEKLREVKNMLSDSGKTKEKGEVAL